jgi:PAS domain S-box-containing protein
VENVSDGLIKVSKGEIFGFIDTIASIGYTIHQENFLHLKIAGEVGAELKLAIAVRNDEEELLAVLNKAIGQLAREDKNEVDSQWIAIKFDKEIDYTLLWQVLAVAILIILIITFWARKLSIAKQQIQLLNKELRTRGERLKFALEGSNDGLWDWNIKSNAFYLSPRWEKMLGYEPGELDLCSDSLMKMINPEQRNEVRQTIDRHLRGESPFYNTEYQMRSKTGEWVWIETRGKVVERGNFGAPIRCVGTHTNISEKKKLQEALLKQLEMIENDQRFLNTVLDSQNQIIIITNGNKIQKANRSFLNFFAVENLKEFTNKYDCISDVFATSAPKGYLQKQMNDDTWLHYLLTNPENTHQVLIEKKGDYCVFSASAVNLNQKGKDLFLAVFSDITELEESEKQMTDSIEYSSLIQHALIPYDELFSRNFDQHFAIWQPRDVVGGDIYLFEELRNENECLLMMIDCTGHGVPGAFVTMLVKAIERQVIGEINSSKQEVSTALILNVFNKSIKTMLRQQQENDSISNAGFDGGILYINYTDKIARYSGAYTPLFIIQDDELKMIEGDRQSIGYKKSDINFQFTEHTFSIEKETRLYLTTDGYLDQIGGEKRFRFGKRRFKRLVEESFKLPMEDQQDKFLEHMRLYQGKEDAIDDITLIGLKLKNNQNKK